MLSDLIPIYKKILKFEILLEQKRPQVPLDLSFLKILKLIFVLPGIDLLQKRSIGENGKLLKNPQVTVPNYIDYDPRVQKRYCF